jgi:hypothetical protein
VISANEAAASHPIDESQPSPTHKHAIAYLMAGCDESSCLAYLLNLLVAKSILDYYNFTGDVVAMIRLGPHLTQIPQHSWLERAGIVIRYLPSLAVDNFALAQLEKFRVMNLTDYDRILYLDSDAIPLCNLDYVFEASYSGIISPFMAMAQSASPATGSIFLVKPRAGEFEKLMQLVRNQTSQRTSFDILQGWGHVIHPPDDWVSFSQRGRNWTFYGASADQGLLYHYMKYVIKNWTLTFRGALETWRQVPPEYPARIPLEDGTFIARVNRSKRNHGFVGCHSPRYDRGPWAQEHLYADHYHFAGHRKPWLRREPKTGLIHDESRESSPPNLTSAKELWWYWLSRANYTLELHLPRLLNLSRPTLGFAPKGHHLFAPNVELPRGR